MKERSCKIYEGLCDLVEKGSKNILAAIMRLEPVQIVTALGYVGPLGVPEDES